jgi:hypothetical protein
MLSLNIWKSLNSTYNTEKNTFLKTLPEDVVLREEISKIISENEKRLLNFNPNDISSRTQSIEKINEELADRNKLLGIELFWASKQIQELKENYIASIDAIINREERK